ncbi:MAG: hypothetical protein A2V70_03645 [Planctomycetes bacterium RBG_13_63_9]|nr:MAG: hypothetical protein A2V70_03645 [Planctomycetes bacterium RBG_13_63_9]
MLDAKQRTADNKSVAIEMATSQCPDSSRHDSKPQEPGQQLAEPVRSRFGYWGENPNAGNCFVPIPFAKSLRISRQGPVGFYHFRSEEFLRHLDQNHPRQAADVYVDEQYAGTWYHPDHNPHLRWFDSDYDLAADLTRGKPELKVRLVVKEGQGQGHGAFTDFRYQVLVFSGTSDAASE